MPVDFSKLNFACMGDSITSDEVSGIGTLICRKLGAHLTGNFAHGNAICGDYCDLFGSNTTEITLRDVGNNVVSGNTLSNQVRRLIARTTEAGKNITWTHPIDGEFALPEECGLGEGYKDEIPDIIYIAISCNDGKDNEDGSLRSPVYDDVGEVFRRSYAELDRIGIASALRWAVETLQSAYPDTEIFLASPLQSASHVLTEAFNPEILSLKRDIIRNTAELCSVFFMDSFAESGFSRLWAKAGGCGIAIHPNDYWKNRIAAYAAHQINSRYFAF